MIFVDYIENKFKKKRNVWKKLWRIDLQRMCDENVSEFNLKFRYLICMKIFYYAKCVLCVRMTVKEEHMKRAPFNSVRGA